MSLPKTFKEIIKEECRYCAGYICSN